MAVRTSVEVLVSLIARAVAIALSVSLAACVVGDDPDDFAAPDEAVIALAATVDLGNGTPISGLDARRTEELHYRLEVPAGATGLRLAISGGAGDADLYVRFGAAPTRTTYDHRPYLNGNDEAVTPSPVRAGTYFVMLRAYADFSGVTLTASFTAPDQPPPPPPTGPDCRDAGTWPAEWVGFEDQVVALINARRAAGATCGGVSKPAVGPVVVDAHLREASRCHSLDMATLGYFSHTGQDGSSPWDRIAEAGYTASPTGENIAAGYATPQQVVDGWMTSTGHCNNIMNAGSNETGVGYAYRQGSPYGRYWTQAFGRR